MNRTNLVFGLTLLCLAGAMAVLRTERNDEDHAAVSADRAPGTAAAARTRRPFLERSTSLHHPSHHAPAHLPLLETLSVEPAGESHPALEAQALRVQTGARNRLQELAEELDLSDRQQIEIFPLLARSHPDYSHTLHLVGIPATSALSPLGKLAAQREIKKHLSFDQQLDLEILAASADVWWTDVIALLEKDLVESTRDPAAGREPTERPVPSDFPGDDPSPPNDDPPAPPAVIPPNPRGHNLFDLLQR